MTKYGNTTTMQELAWGGAKATLPAVVTAVQNQVTALINLSLNRNEDFSTVPEYINQVANTSGSEILRNLGRTTELTFPQINDMIKVLLKEYMDQAPSTHGRWGNVRIV